MPGRAAGQLFAFEQHDVAPAHFGQVISDGTTDDAAANDDGPRVFWQIQSHRLNPHPRIVRIESRSSKDRRGTPLAEAARKDFMALGRGGLVHATLGYHWARLVCMIHCAETIRDLLFDDDLQGTDLVVTGRRRPEGIAMIEAPRGTLLHHYTVDDNDQVTGANLIVSTTNNNEAMNRSVTKVAIDDLTGHEITEGLLNHIEVAIRAYDPCLSCATHALGDMPLIVTLEDADGAVIATRVKQ